MADTITLDLMRRLAGFRAAKGRVISLYLNLDPALAPTQPDVATRIKALLDEARKQGGWSQARYERHIDEIVARHLRRVADAIERCLRELNGAKVVLIGPEEVRPAFDDMLANDLKQAIAGWTTTEAHAGPAELLEAAQPVLERARAKEDEELLDRWREGAGREARASSGWKETLAAASDGRV